MPISENDKHFVYLIRDRTGRPIYVGLGEKPGRPNDHATSRAHNQDLSEQLGDNQYSVEITGPFGSSEIAKIVEAAVLSSISATPSISKFLCNKNDGASKWRFRPIAVPLKLATRTNEPPLTGEDLYQLAAKSGPLLFVFINDKDFDDGRKGFHPEKIPSDEEILSRMEKRWQVRHRLEGWEKTPRNFPKILIGVTGPIESRRIIGAARIHVDRNGKWQIGEEHFHKQGRVTVPVDKTGKISLDYQALRGKRISADSGLKFNSFAQAEYRIFPPQE